MNNLEKPSFHKVFVYCQFKFFFRNLIEEEKTSIECGGEMSPASPFFYIHSQKDKTRGFPLKHISSLVSFPMAFHADSDYWRAGLSLNSKNA
jgi:hypothetical protein